MKKLILILFLYPLLSFGQFTNYSTINGLIGNNVQCFCENASGNLWIGTTGGLSYYDGVNFTNFTISDGLISNAVKAIEISNTNKVWIGTGSGISVFDGFSFTNYTTAEGLISNNVYDIQKDTAGNIWIATLSGISVFNGFTFVNYTVAEGLPTNSIRQISMDDNGAIWIGTGAGLCRFDNPGFTTYTIADGMPTNIISILTAKDKVYMGAGGGRICVFDGITFTTYDDSNGLPISLIKDIAVDADTNIWITNSSNLIKFDLLNVDIYNSSNTNLSGGLSDVHTINNDVLVATGSNGYFISGNNMLIDEYDTLQINNIHALVNANGILFQSGNNWNNIFEVPAGSGKMSNFASTIWIGGMDEDNLFHMAAGRFNHDTDWETGPISNNYNTIEYDSIYNRVWKINKSTIDYHIQHWNDTGYIVPPSILKWPDIAEYLDSNLNSIYDPDSGDYPLIMGDQAILCIYNDDINEATVGRNKMKAEVHSLVYGYNEPTDSALYNTVFVQYKIKNKSIYNYSNVYMGVYDDIDIGDAWDDYIGVDTSTNAYYIYNGDDYDDVYGSHIPAQGVAFLSSKMTSSTYFNNTFGITGDPETPMEYFNVLTGYWRDGSPYTDGGTGYGGTTPVNYVFTGNPESPTDWNEAFIGNTPGDRRGVGIVGPFTLDLGQEICIDVAHVNAIAYDGDNILSVKYLHTRMEEIQLWKSQNPGLSCDSIITIPSNDLFIFAQDTVFCADHGNISLYSINVGGVYPFTYEWADSTGAVFSTDENPTIPLPINSPTNYYVTITDAQSNTATDTLTVYINTLPVINLGNYSDLCSGDTVTIDISGFSQYQWSNGNTTGIVHLTLPGDYYVTVTDSIGCVTEDNTNLSFTPNTINLNEITPSCVGGSVTIDAGSGFSSYLWSTTATTQSIVVNTPFTGQATYSVTVTTSIACTFTDYTIVDVTAPYTYLGNDTSILSNATLSLNPGNYVDYLWSDGSTIPQYVFNGNVGIGTYSVWVQTTDYYGCASSDTIVIIVSPLGFFNPDLDAIEVFPNPTNGKITVQAEGIERIEIIDIHGKEIQIVIEIGSSNNKEIDLSDFSKGIYIIKVTTKKGVVVGKVVLE